METLESYTLENKNKGIKVVPYQKDGPVAKVTVRGHKKLNGFYERKYLIELGIITK